MTSKYMRILLNINLQFLSAEENGLINSWIFFLAGDRRPPATLLGSRSSLKLRFLDYFLRRTGVLRLHFWIFSLRGTGVLWLYFWGDSVHYCYLYRVTKKSLPIFSIRYFQGAILEKSSCSCFSLYR